MKHLKNKLTNKNLSGDIEANGLLYEADQVWCVVLVDEDSGETFTFHNRPEFEGQHQFTVKDKTITFDIPAPDGSLLDGIRAIYYAAHNDCRLSFHNALGYDKFLVEKHWPSCITPVEAWNDTLIRSKVQFFERATPKGTKSKHGLEAYGLRFGVPKPPVEDWTVFTPYLLHRCIEDVKIQVETTKYLDRECDKLKSLGIDVTEAMQVSSEYRINSTMRQMKGVNIDKAHVEKCITELDTFIETLREEIEPQLPKTIKKPSKVTNKELAKKLGWVSAPLPTYDDDYNEVKQFCSPTVAYRDAKETYYVGKSDWFGVTPTFSKLKDARDWVNMNFPDKKIKDFNIKKETRNIKVLNSHVYNYYSEYMLLEEVEELVGGSFTKVEYLDSRMSQHAIVKSYLLDLGWIPTEYNYKRDSEGALVRDDKGELVKTTPKLTEDSFDSLPEGIGKKIANYNTYSHRRKFFENPDDPTGKGLKAAIRSDGRVEAGINDFGAASSRGTHYNVVNLAGAGALYGEKVRQSFIASRGNKLVGVDMKSAQLSIAAYYANNYAYYHAVAEGQESIRLPDGTEKYLGESGHCVNARMFTLVSESEWEEAVRTQDKELIHSITLRRKKSKGGSFACLPVHNTKVLTVDGWKSYNELSIGELVLTYNTETCVNEWKPITALHFFNDKEVINMNNNEWSMQSTTDHRWFGYRRTGKGSTRREVAEFITTENIKSEFKILNSAPYKSQDTSIVTPNEAAILGWIFSDGSVSWSEDTKRTSSSFGNKRGVKAVITQTDHKYGSVIEDLLKTEGCFTGKSYKKGAVNPCANYNINSSYFRKLWSKSGFGQLSKHEVDLEAFALKLNTEALTSFLEAFFLADGHHCANGSKIYTQNRGNIQKGIHLMLYLQGNSVSISSKGIYEPTGKECVDMRVRIKPYTGSTNLKKESLGIMDTFCITTENSTFVCKQGDVITITGNCIFGASGKKVAQTLGIPEQIGEEKKQAFLSNIGLDKAIAMCETMLKSYPRSGGGYIELPFGFYIHCSQKHKLFNYLDQGTEACLQKYAFNLFQKECIKQGYHPELSDGTFAVIDYHDELLLDVPEDLAADLGKLMSWCYTQSGIAMQEWHAGNSKFWVGDSLPNFCIDLGAGYKVGDDYYAVH